MGLNKKADTSDEVWQKLRRLDRTERERLFGQIMQTYCMCAAVLDEDGVCPDGCDDEDDEDDLDEDGDDGDDGDPDEELDEDDEGTDEEEGEPA